MSDSPPRSRPASPTPNRLVEHFFRHETGRLHAVLLRLLGTHRWQLAEDIAQEAMMRAMRTWAMGGTPPNPSAWITRVAKNLALDALRRERMVGAKESALVTHHEQHAPTLPSPAVAWETSREIRDDALRLLFVCGHPEIPPDAQVILALKVICGFTTGEIARAFLASEAAIEKQLTRTKRRIAEAGLAFELPEGAELESRLDAVLGTLYLLFNEGYKASSGETLLREDLCEEAIRLTRLLAGHSTGNSPRTHALLALMLFNAARFATRTGETGTLIRLATQDRSRWDTALIDEGLRHLDASTTGAELTPYHLEAAIAAQHCLATSLETTDWNRIVACYDALQRLNPSPIVLLNRAVALSYADGPAAALEAVEALRHFTPIQENSLFLAVEADLRHRLGQDAKAASLFRRAAALATTEPERHFLEQRAQAVVSGSMD